MTKFDAYVARILLCESCKFDEKIYYSNWDNEFLLRDCFFIGARCSSCSIGLLQCLRDATRSKPHWLQVSCRSWTDGGPSVSQSLIENPELEMTSKTTRGGGGDAGRVTSMMRWWRNRFVSLVRLSISLLLCPSLSLLCRRSSPKSWRPSSEERDPVNSTCMSSRVVDWMHVCPLIRAVAMTHVPHRNMTS